MDPGDETLTAPIIRMEVDERGASGAMLRVLDALRGRGYESVQLVGKPASNPAPGDP